MCYIIASSVQNATNKLHLMIFILSIVCTKINTNMAYIELKTKDIKILKEKLHKQNEGICPLLGVQVPPEQMALDHIHKLKSEDYADDKGTIRNAIEFRANALEGKITNNWKRYYGADTSKHLTDLPTFLRNLADYLEAGAYTEDGDFYIHPSEVPKLPKVKKSSYNKMIKLFKIKYPKKKVPPYPKSKKLTKLMDKLFTEFDITDFYYS